MNPEVEQSVKELQRCFPNAELVVRPVDDGGAVVTIDPIDLGPSYTPRQTWMKFAIGFQYPHADIYPLFISADVTRVDGQPHGEGISESSFDGDSALQLSRRSNRLNPAVDTAALKVNKVIQWFQHL
ncbi:MAG: hypothetical protein OXC83_05790 [Chloroflexi bacterium]|nr:hypothetical protein [Chloroflexota bacterium]